MIDACPTVPARAVHHCIHGQAEHAAGSYVRIKNALKLRLFQATALIRITGEQLIALGAMTHMHEVHSIHADKAPIISTFLTPPSPPFDHQPCAASSRLWPPCCLLRASPSHRTAPRSPAALRARSQTPPGVKRAAPAVVSCTAVAAAAAGTGTAARPATRVALATLPTTRAAPATRPTTRAATATRPTTRAATATRTTTQAA